ncbi:DUF1836 domain-containing protein [Ruminococcaceae bacterium OttesenSCG-928-O06]|nr:DUF1836 domain-containing protein [Ruminococcaceae bacterium OttesenSCG-928-O06]
MQNTKQATQGFHCPRWEELPGIPLYMDQVIFLLEESLGAFADDKERVVTPTMVNNYVKHKQIEPPVKKRYSRQHLAILVVVSVMKRVLSIGEITTLVSLMVERYGAQQAYDLFCEQLEEMLQGCYTQRPLQAAAGADEMLAALNAALNALGGKLYLQDYLAGCLEETPQPTK